MKSPVTTSTFLRPVALAVLAVIGRFLPHAMRTFLLTLAVVDDLLARCRFPAPGATLVCGVSGGADSLALLADAPDPGTLFVKTVKVTSQDASYDQNTFYEAWRTAIQRYGIYNPWTKRGAIEGLLPHGPHNVRDVLATHILKRTGSYEQASYAIQDTPDMVAQHYGRFLPQDKSEIAARILNQVWEAA